MTLFAFDNDVDDDLSELRAEAAAERRRLRPHWCSECRGFDGPGSPCYVEPDDEPTTEDDSDE
jgi:hypothetical protein